jgi:hypothetical protein
MPDEHFYDGGALLLIRRGSVELTQMAEMGVEGTGTVVVDDVAGTQPIVGQLDYAVTETDCANPDTWSGFVDETDWEREGTPGRGPKTGASRGIAVQLLDLNNYLNHTGITGADGNRKDGGETVNERLEWLFNSDYWPAAVAIGSRVASSSIELDKADYRQQQPGDVLADIATATGWEYYVADWGSGPELTFRDDNTSTDDSSAIRISNVSGDKDSDGETLGATKTFGPSMDFKLNRSWREVYSKMSLSYGKGTRTKTRTATAVNGERYGTASTSNIKTAALADAELARLLNVHSTPRDFLEGSIQVPSSAVNLLRQGERLQIKLQELGNTGARDYDEWTWCRVKERTVKPLVTESPMYELRLRLAPQEAAPTPSTCAGLYPDTPAGIYYPLGGVNPCCTPNDVGTNIAYYFRSGWPEPWFPQPEYSGQWHFPTYGIGGVGTRDTFASGFGNVLKFIVIGSGTLTIQTSQWSGQSQPYTISVWSNTLGTPVNSGVIDSGVAGDSIDVEITADVDNCIHVIDLRADARTSSYIGMGWAQAEWVPA